MLGPTRAHAHYYMVFHPSIEDWSRLKINHGLVWQNKLDIARENGVNYDTMTVVCGG
jgi:hypothetical protein